MIIALNDEIDDIKVAMNTILEDNSMLKLYDESMSYFWKNRITILESLEVLKGKDLSIDSNLLHKFRKWRKEKAERDAERKDDIGRMLMTTSEATDG